MRFPTELGRSQAVVRGLALVALFSLGLGSSCSSNHLGRPCDPGAPVPTASGGGQIVTVASPALECPSRICVDVANAQGTGPLCSAGCESNADCEDGEIGACKDGFVCMWPTTVGDFACQKLCVCRDFVIEPPGGFQKPSTCP